jgi:hypothetical protein
VEKSTVAWLSLVALAACAGAQEGSSEVFCQSYEENFAGACQQECEGESDGLPGDMTVARECEASCRERLADDDTFSDRCPERAKHLSKG